MFNALNSLGSGGYLGGNGNITFSTTLYTGNGSSQSIVTGRDNSAGSLVWTKVRNSSQNHYLFDTVRNNTQISSNTTNTASTELQGITSYNSDGVTIGSWSGLNTIGNNYVLWTFLESSNFMDIVSFDVDGSGNATVSHNLGSTPALIIVKGLVSATDWHFYHKNLNNGVNPEQYSMKLNTALAESISSVWNNTAPNSTEFTVSGLSSGGASPQYIAYVFANSAAKRISCGGFATDGSGNATVNCGFPAKFSLIKERSGTDNWHMLDIIRGWSTGNDALINADLSGSETSVKNYGAPTPAGFDYSDSSTINSNFIYMAVG